MNLLTSVTFTAGLMAFSLMSATPSRAGGLSPEPAITPLDLHPVDTALSASVNPAIAAMPRIIRRGAGNPPDPSQVQMLSLIHI